MKPLEYMIACILLIGVFNSVKTVVYFQRDGNNYADYVFFAKAKGSHNVIPDNWKSRVVAVELTGAWSDVTRSFLGNDVAIAGFYYTLWIAALFAALIIGLPQATLPMLGVYAGISTNSWHQLHPYLLPWDVPTMFFFTLAYLFYRHQKWTWLIACVLVGGLFKETVLVAALFLLGRKETLKFNAVQIAGIMLASLLFGKMLAPDTHASWTYSIHLFCLHCDVAGIIRNWPILFANAGSLAALLILTPFRKEWPLFLVVFGFTTAQCANNIAYGVYDEFRDWHELLPLGWIILSDYYNKTKL